MIDYYQIAGEASKKIGNHIGLKRIAKLAQSSKQVLDIGCGEGSRLGIFCPNKSATGIDINDQALLQARKNYPHHKFIRQAADILPFESNKFDLVYSAFVLEHTFHPEKIINEAVRVTKLGGNICLLFPNFGAPNRRSPNSTELAVKKLILGLLKDFASFNLKELSWTRVKAKSFYNQIDDDTTIEPYILSLKKYQLSNISINFCSSLWELEPNTLNPRKLLIKFLGQLKIYPFVYWGPQGYIELHKLA